MRRNLRLIGVLCLVALVVAIALPTTAHLPVALLPASLALAVLAASAAAVSELTRRACPSALVRLDASRAPPRA
jgi:hypothetical protein